MLFSFLMSQRLSTLYSKVRLAKDIVLSTSINRFNLEYRLVSVSRKLLQML